MVDLNSTEVERGTAERAEKPNAREQTGSSSIQQMEEKEIRNKEEGKDKKEKLLEEKTKKLKKTIKQELEDNKKIVNEYIEHLQRLQAEFENFQKRTEKEKQDLVLYGKEHLILNLLSVLDSFEHAIDALKKAESKEEMAVGIEMIFKEFKKLLEEEGVSLISSKGKFDPEEHEVMSVMQSDIPEGEIMQELQRGYKLKGRTIRAAKVIVSNGRKEAEIDGKVKTDERINGGN